MVSGVDKDKTTGSVQRSQILASHFTVLEVFVALSQSKSRLLTLL